MDYLLSLFVVLLVLINGFSILNLSGLSLYIKNLRLLIFGFSFFLGTLFLIFSIKLFSLIFSSAVIGLYIFYFLSLSGIYLSRYYLFEVFFNKISLKNVALFIIFYILLFVLLAIFWIQHSDTDNPFAMIGSLHSVRYVEVANFIIVNNYIPIIGQNIGQSIIAYVVLALGAKSGYIALTTFLVSSLIFLIFIVYDLFNQYLKDKKFSLVATFIFFSGNTALTTSSILIIDSGSPFFLIGYTDTFVGMSIMFILLVFYNYISKLVKIGLKQYSMLFFLFAGMFSVAPQNIILILSMLTMLLLVTLIFQSFSIRHKKVLVLSLLFSLITGVPQGGMLTPSVLHDRIEIQGMMKVQQDNISAIKVHPGLMHIVKQVDSFNSNVHFDRLEKILDAKDKKNYRLAFFYVEESLVASLRMVFFPFIGFVILFLMINKIRNKFTSKEILINLDLLKIVGSTLFFIGFFVAFSFMVYGYKWELARFIIPGIMFGMFSFILVVMFLLQKNIKNTNLKIASIIIFVSLAPLSDFVFTIKQRMIENSDVEVFLDRYNAFSQNNLIDEEVK